MSKSIKVAVLGSTGYVGLDLVKILNQHPYVKINFLGCENYSNTRIKQIDNRIINQNLPKLKLNKEFNSSNSDVVFLALPHGISHKYVKKFYKKIRIIDLSADFRLDNLLTYITNYNNDHTCPNLLNKFIYGLPEFNKEKIKNNENISIPGCYPTSVLLALMPLIKENLLLENNIIIDSKSGYSGAGKKFNLKQIINDNDNNFYNYNTNQHRHICEIRQELNKCSVKKFNFSFNPHILPVFRGMMTTIYCDLEFNISETEIYNSFKNFANKNPFIHLYNQNQQADLFNVQNTNNCILKLFKSHSDNKIIIVSIIDNLIKGAAGQAVQCFNISFNFEETLSLI